MIAPYLFYDDAAAAIAFLTDAFGLREVLRVEEPDGRIRHAELAHGDASLYLSDAGGASCASPGRARGVTVQIHLYVDDVDAHYARATAAAATVTRELEDRDYGDRRYHAADPEGHIWMIGQRVREPAPEWTATLVR